VGLGGIEEARTIFEKAIVLAPMTGRYYRALFNIRRASPEDKYFASMVALARGMASLPVAEQMELHFALGKAYADLGQHERSFHHLLAGNALKRQTIVYDEPRRLASFDRIRTVFTQGLMNARRGVGAQSDVPIFIVGMLRSGTTLIEQILASHPKVFGAGELHDLSKLAAGLESVDDTTLSFPEIVRKLSNEDLGRFGGSYLNAVVAKAPGVERITDKMPGNFSLIGLIHMALPNAKIIHMRRDPIDTCLSCFSILFSTGQPHTYDLAELGRYYRAYETLMEHWRRVLPAGVMLELRYEDLVSDTERQARGVIAHCGLDWDDSCLAFHTTRRAVRTASAIQVRQPIYRTSVGRSRFYTELLRPLIRELGSRE
jgi:hypothetical protein